MIEFRNVPLVKQVYDMLEREVNNALRSQDVTLSQIQLLLRLSKKDGGTLSLKELEAQLSVSQATIAGLVKRLEQKGLVKLLDDKRDKRVKHAQITVSGLLKCDEARGHMDVIERKLGLTIVEAQLFYQLLKKAIKNMK